MGHQPSGPPQAAGTSDHPRRRGASAPRPDARNRALEPARDPIAVLERVLRASQHVPDPPLRCSQVALALVAQGDRLRRGALRCCAADPAGRALHRAGHLRPAARDQQRGLRLGARHAESTAGRLRRWTRSWPDASSPAPRRRQGIFRTFGSLPGEPDSLDTGLFHGFVTTPTTIAFVDAMLAAVLAAIVAVEVTKAILPTAAIGIWPSSWLAQLAYFGYRSQGDGAPLRRVATGTGATAPTDQQRINDRSASPANPPPSPESLVTPRLQRRRAIARDRCPAGFTPASGSRFLAFLIDGILLGVIGAA